MVNKILVVVLTVLILIGIAGLIVLGYSMEGEVEYVNDKACFDDLMSNGINPLAAGAICYGE